MTCRKYQVISSPVVCHRPTVSSDVAVYAIPEVELLVSAAFDSDRKNSNNQSFATLILNFLSQLKPKPIA